MPLFAYKVARADGTTFVGEVEDDNEIAVRNKLEGQGFLVFRVEEFLPAELDEGIKNGLRKEIFDAWLRQELSRSPIQFPLLEALNAGQRPT